MEQRPAKTVLAWGEISVPVGLYKTAREKHGSISFDRAGPNGGRLLASGNWGNTLREPEPVASGKLTVPDDVFAEESEESFEDTSPPGVRYEASSFPLLVEEGTGVEIKRTQDVRRGIFDSAGTFHDLTEHLAAVDTLTHLDEMRIEGFINRDRISRGRIAGSYWVAPDGQGNVLRLLWAAMADEYRAAVVRWTKRTRQALGVIVPSAEGLLLLEMSWINLVNEPRPEVRLMADRQVEPAHLTLARELVTAMAVGEEVLNSFEDQGAQMREYLRQEALDGRDPEVPKPKRDEDLTAALAEALG